MYSFFFFFSSRRRHTRLQGDWSSDACSSDLRGEVDPGPIYTTILCDLYARLPGQLDLLSHVLPIDVLVTQSQASRESLHLPAPLVPDSGASISLDPDGE